MGRTNRRLPETDSRRSCPYKPYAPRPSDTCYVSYDGSISAVRSDTVLTGQYRSIRVSIWFEGSHPDPGPVPVPTHCRVSDPACAIVGCS